MLFLFWACVAQSLKVLIPPKGHASVHQEDIKRDVWAIERGDSPLEWWLRRSSQFGADLVDDDGSSCLSFQGEEERGLLYWIESNGSETKDLGIRLATLLALAKSSDRLKLKRAYQYCFGLPENTEGWELQKIEMIVGQNIRIEDSVWRTSGGQETSFTALNFEDIVKSIQQIIASNSPDIVEASKY